MRHKYRRHRNPGVATMTRKLGAGFSFPVLKTAAGITGAAVINNYGTQWLSKKLAGTGFGASLGDQSSPLNYITSLLTTGGLFFLSSMMSPAAAGYVLLGGAADVVSRAAKRYVEPTFISVTAPLRPVGPAPTVVSTPVGPVAVPPGVHPAAAAAAAMSGLGRMGDYLTVANSKNLHKLGHGYEADGEELDTM